MALLKRVSVRTGAQTLLGAISCSASLAQTIPSDYGTFGANNLLDMPTSAEIPDAELGTTFSHFSNSSRVSLSFQIAPRLSGTFRYSAHESGDPRFATNYDRSFDLHYRFLDETQFRPSFAIGLRDLMGTGWYGAEYIVASKSLTPTLRVTGGLGWGRLGSRNPIGSTGTRPTDILGAGGIPNYDKWFRGDFAPFAGVAWTPRPELTFKLEYSSDIYRRETARGMIDQKTPINFGVDYRFNSGVQLSLFSMYGTDVGAQVTFTTNPKKSRYASGFENAPLPVLTRKRNWPFDFGRPFSAEEADEHFSRLETLLNKEGLSALSLKVDGSRATLWLSNPRYGAEPQAIGRAARAMTRILPPHVERFSIVPVESGIATIQVVLKRTDIENLEHAPASEILARAEFLEGTDPDNRWDLIAQPRFRWSLDPYLKLNVFDPDNPVRGDVGLRLRAAYALSPGLELSTSITKKIAGNLDTITRQVPSNLPRVRSDYALYSKFGDPAIESLALASYNRFSDSVFSRFTLGYLEEMYGGFSAEVLWKPVDSPLALGAELNYVKQRDFDQLFGFREYETATGHVSAYYRFNRGYLGRLDVGRYLAGDVGATISFEREFANGWRIGAYATKTNVTSAEFGEGSFDKGLYFTIPFSFYSGQPSKSSNTLLLQSLSRDGGARLNVDGRLYDKLRGYGAASMSRSWGRFWR